MEIQEALDIVCKLANCVHPETGEALQRDSPYQRPQAVSALHCAIAALELSARARTGPQVPGSQRGRPGRIRKARRFVMNCVGESISKG